MKNGGEVKAYFAIHEVIVLSGFTKYMLDYLSREQIFAPSGLATGKKGLRRRYTYEDVVLLRALHAVCMGRGKIRHLKDALVKFRNEFGPMIPGQRIERHLFVQGDELCVYSSSEGGRQLRSGQTTFSFVVDLSAITHEIALRVQVEPASNRCFLTPSAALQAEEERQKIWASVKARREARKHPKPLLMA